MDLDAWCGRCGESFALAEVVDPAGDVPIGDCPRCGVAFAPSYTPVLVSVVRQLLAATEALLSAAGQLHDIAPGLHVERRALVARLEEHLQH